MRARSMRTVTVPLNHDGSAVFFTGVFTGPIDGQVQTR